MFTHPYYFDIHVGNCSFYAQQSVVTINNTCTLFCVLKDHASFLEPKKHKYVVKKFQLLQYLERGEQNACFALFQFWSSLGFRPHLLVYLQVVLSIIWPYLDILFCPVHKMLILIWEKIFLFIFSSKKITTYAGF